MSQNIEKKKQEEKIDEEIASGKGEKSTDPQEHMKGPVSSVMQSIKEEGAKGNKESKEEAENKRNENM